MVNAHCFSDNNAFQLLVGPGTDSWTRNSLPMILGLSVEPLNPKIKERERKNRTLFNTLPT